MLNEYKAIPWGDIIEFFVLSLAFFYWASAVQNYPLPIKSKLPGFMLNRKIMLAFGFVCGAIAASKFF
ncbi:conserved hypothetical protein [Pseudomonas sp. 8Z]|uniref:hypothetical protein n=1 Tax=Pseudomonas sp. 8Z TaxID=2653166 RepID=UPI0012F0CF96|nr:hypothetical protein [Pseudomonas sp. 8Z]VXC90308.1 conserved hypothetical protein [Pseudomonas sp. 8Z]